MGRDTEMKFCLFLCGLSGRVWYVFLLPVKFCFMQSITQQSSASRALSRKNMTRKYDKFCRGGGRSAEGIRACMEGNVTRMQRLDSRTTTAFWLVSGSINRVHEATTTMGTSLKKELMVHFFAVVCKTLTWNDQIPRCVENVPTTTANFLNFYFKFLTVFQM